MTTNEDEVVHMLATPSDAEQEHDVIFDDDSDDIDDICIDEPKMIYMQKLKDESTVRSQVEDQFPREEAAMTTDGKKPSREHQAVRVESKSRSVLDEGNRAVPPSSTMDALPKPTSPTVVSFSGSTKPAANDVPVLAVIDDLDPSPTPRGPLSPASEITMDNNPKTNHSVLTIEHAVSERPRSAAFLLGMSKPVFMAIAGILLLLCVSNGVFLAGWTSVPGLNNQIKSLESEVDRLKGEVVQLTEQVDRLTSQVDRFSSQVDKLKQVNDELTANNDQLTAENEQFSELNGALNATTLSLEMQVQNLTTTKDALSSEVDRLEKENSILSSTSGQISGGLADLLNQVQLLQNTTASLNVTNEALQVEVLQLNQTVSTLNQTNENLRTTNAELSSEIVTLQGENRVLRDENDRLESIISYLNDTTTETFDQIVTQLSNLIENDRNILLQTLKSQYSSIVDGWRCDFPLDFAGLSFINNPTISIGDSNYPSVIDNVETGALVPLCLNVTNFQQYLQSVAFPGLSTSVAEVSTNQVRSAVAQYTTMALNYYFPDANEQGLSADAWDSAGYDCTALPSSLTFSDTV